MSANLQLQLGQEVAVESAYGRRETSFGWSVKKVTPKGQVIVTRKSDGYEMRFDADGFEMKTGSRYYRSRLLTNLDAAREKTRQMRARADAAARINHIRGDVTGYYDKDAMLREVEKLEAALAEARRAVEAI